METTVKEIRSLLGDFYSTFILRDLLSRASPGFVLLAVAVHVADSSSDVFEFVQRVGPPGYFVVAAISWLIGLSRHGAAFFLCFLRLNVPMKGNVPDRGNSALWARWQVWKLDRTLDQRSVLDRMAVLKEATAIACVSFALGAIALTVNACCTVRWTDHRPYAIALFLFAVSILSALMNRRIWEAQVRFFQALGAPES